jgi:hypothetical protein
LFGHSEREVEINADIGIVLCGAVVDRRIVVNNGLSDHTSHTASAAIAPLSSRRHDTSRLTAGLLKGGQTSRDVKLKIKAAATVAALHHHNDWLLVGT